MKVIFLVLAFFIVFSPLAAENAKSEFKLQIFYTNDMHGGIVHTKAAFLNPEFPPFLGGGASAAALINKHRKIAEENGDATLLLDSGDIFQGTLVGTLSKGKAVVEYMNAIGYDAVCPGNHEFDLGRDNLEEVIKQSNFPWVSCNIYEEKTGKLWSVLKPYIIKEIHGLKIGFTGVTTVTTEHMSFPDNVKGLKFLPEVPTLQKTIDHMKQVEKVDLVIVMAHAGLPYNTKDGYANLQKTTYQQVIDRGHANAMEMARFLNGVDILLGGHIHKGYQKPWVDPVNHTICLQTYGNGTNLGWLTAEVDSETKSISGFEMPADGNSMLLLQEDEFWPDSSFAEMIKKQQAVYEKGFDEVIGSTRTALTRAGFGEAPMYNLITDAMRIHLKADFAFTNFGGIRSDLKIGALTKEDIFKVLPFGNQLVMFKADGKFLKRLIESKIRGNRRGMAISSAKVVYNKTLPDDQRITKFLIDGKPIEANKIYRIVTTDYLMEGNSGLTILKELDPQMSAYAGMLMRDAVISYIRKNSPLEVKIEGRWEKDDNAKADPEWIKSFGKIQAEVKPVNQNRNYY